MILDTGNSAHNSTETKTPLENEGDKKLDPDNSPDPEVESKKVHE